jgi:hypothetical protein
MSNPYITFSHPDVHNGAERRFTATLQESMPRGVLAPRKLELAADGAVLLTLAPRTYTVHQLRLLIDTRDGAPYGTYEDLTAYHRRGEVTIRDWANNQAVAVIINERLDPVWLTPDGSVMFVNVELLIKPT